MILPILEGALLGLGLSLLIGPVFFMLIETGANDGMKRAFYLDLGVITSDILCVTIVYFGLSQFFQHPWFKEYLYIIGGIIFVIFGLVKVFPNPKKKFKKFGKKKSFIQLYVKGFFFNILNPGVIFFWIATVAFVASSFTKKMDVFAYFIATFITVWVFDFFKIWGAASVKKWLTPKRLFRMGQIIGVCFIAFGIILFFKAVFELKLL